MSSGIVPRPVNADLLYAEHGRYLWSLCYRMTGNAADAEDLVQETFIRAIEKPPPKTDAPMRPWLVRVAMNLSRDLLRRRRRRGYRGSWLPSPVELDTDWLRENEIEDCASSRYDTMESLSFAFLLAMEHLTPAQRAVLILRDVVDYSVRETAQALDMSEANVKVTHHRTRAKMATYDDSRRPPTPELVEKTAKALTSMLALFAAGDFVGLEGMLATGVRAVSDGGGVTPAAKKPVVGREKVFKMYSNLAQRFSPNAKMQVRIINGVPALVAEDPDVQKPNAARSVLRIELDESGRVCEIQTVLNPAKLTAIWPAARAD